jgi:hypothetical protein
VLKGVTGLKVFEVAAKGAVVGGHVGYLSFFTANRERRSGWKN